MSANFWAWHIICFYGESDLSDFVTAELTEFVSQVNVSQPSGENNSPKNVEHADH